jgi:hypothetical protein
MRRGYSVVWSGWQGDLLPGDGRLTMDLPIPTLDGQEITGPSRCEYIADTPGVTTIPLSANEYTRSYETALLDTEAATFTMRQYERDERIPIPAGEWSFSQVDEAGSVEPSPAHLHYPAGFEPGWIYELVYTARNPPVMGLGFTGLRDLISFLLHDAADSDGTPNPLRDGESGIEKAYAWGRSQSGRFLREFVYQGFNADHQGRRVFDGISPHVAGAGRAWLNCRFAQAGRYPLQHHEHLYPSDQFPFAYAVTTDPLTGKNDGILKRPETDPLVIHTQTSSEYWERCGSLVHTDSAGDDLPDHERSRVFLFAGSQHNADPLLPSPEERRASGEVEPATDTAYPTNPLNTSALLRALLDALNAWAADGTPPPDSRVPRRSDGTGVSAAVARERFPAIPGVLHPSEVSRLHVLNFGPDFERGVIIIEPPEVDPGREYAVLIPQVDEDGNEIPGIRSPHVEVPLVTYAGWNFRPEGDPGPAMAGVTGSLFPFGETRAEREAAGDPRPSIEERYPAPADYVHRITGAAQSLVEQRLLLEEDAERYVELARRFGA